MSSPSATRDLLLEIGCEELPASFVEGALAALPGLVTKRLDALRLGHGAARPLGSPRRISLIVEGIAERQPDVEEELTGPPAAAAFDKEGKPTKGGEAFAKKLGVDVTALKIVETPKGKYVAGTRKEAGRAAKELIGKVLVDAIAEIPFRKSMRWGASDVAFGRPIHWIVALLGDEPIDLEYAGAKSGRATRGHRFLAPEALEIASPAEYVSKLAAAHVQVDVDARKRTMVERLAARAKELGGVLQDDAFLVDENAGLVEEPFIVDGGFEQAFLELPDRLILDVMRTHQRYFGVRDGKGALLPKYLAVVNTDRAPETIRKGNDRVMRARLSDAQFFVQTDRKAGLDTYAKKLAGIRYHAKLGTVADKVERIAIMAERIAGHAQAPTERFDKIQRAAALCKADLASLTVGEFPEMQGYAGRDIALATGIDAEIADAIADHWLAPEDLSRVGALGIYLGLADKFDHFVGGFAAGLAPTGANDPFSIRRAFNRAVGAYLTALARGVGGKLPHLVMLAKIAHETYAARGQTLPKTWEQIEVEITLFMKARLVGLFDEAVDAGANAEALAGYRAPRDVVEACVEAGFEDLADLRARISAIRDAQGTAAFARLATAFKRASKITKEVAPGEPDPARFDHPSEKALWQAYAEARGVIQRATESGDYRKAVEATATALADPIDTFFDKDRGVFVMAEDLAVRENRLRMLATIAGALRKVAKLELLGG
ncbi:MAG: glycine--tRNA ligase subunit beta [Deltaproteobacteria bacterium]|nr:glycine--tRNA ligase subunit beta [Deltaproteobacteria bacterium]